MNRSFVLLVALTGLVSVQQSGLCAAPVRQPAVRPIVKPATTNSAKSAKSKPKKGTRSIPGSKTNLPAEEGPNDSTTIIQPVETPTPLNFEDQPIEAFEVTSLSPKAVAEIQEDPAFRMLVTVNGTILKKESEHDYRLQRGSVLFCPDREIVVTTPACKATLHQGSVVAIDVSESTTYIRDFNDRWKGHVVVKTEHDPELAMMPGVEIIISNVDTPEEAWIQARRLPIRRRGLVQVVSDKHHTVYKGEFSIPDAMARSEHFILLQRSGGRIAKSVVEEVLKTAALLHMNDTRGPFTFLE